MGPDLRRRRPDAQPQDDPLHGGALPPRRALAIQNFSKPLSIGWGMLDPVATDRVLEAVLELRPSAPLTRFEDLGHYPQIEDPERVVAAIRGALSA